MALDASIYGNVKQLDSPMESYSKALNMSQLALQNNRALQSAQDQQSVRDAFQKNIGPDGQVNRQGVLSDLAKSAPMQAMDYQGKFAQMDAAKADAQQKLLADKINHLGWAAQMAMSAKDQPSYEKMIQQMQGMGFDMSHMPAQYDPGLMRQYALGSIDQKQRLEAMTKTSEMDINQSKAPLEREKLAAETGKIKSEVGDKQRTIMTDYQKMLLGDERYKKSAGALTEGKNAMAAIEDATKNPGSAANVPIMLARFTSAGSRMNENEIEANIKAGAFGDRLKQMYEKGQNGTLTPEMADYAKQFVTTQMGSAAKNKADIETQHAKLYSNASGLPLDVAHYNLTASMPGALADVPAGPSRFASKRGAAPDSGVQSAYAAPPPIKPGAVDSGYVFMGGDPSQPSSWKKAR